MSLNPLRAGGSFDGSFIIHMRTKGWMTEGVQTGASFPTSSCELLITLEAMVQRRLDHDVSGAALVTIFELVTKPLSLGLRAEEQFVVPETGWCALKTYWPGVRVVDPPILNTRKSIESCK